MYREVQGMKKPRLVMNVWDRSFVRHGWGLMTPSAK